MTPVLLIVIVVLFVVLSVVRRNMDCTHVVPPTDIDYYYITLGDSVERANNMETQQEKVDAPLKKVDAVVGKNLKVEEIDSFRPHDENSFSKKKDLIAKFQFIVEIFFDFSAIL